MGETIAIPYGEPSAGEIEVWPGAVYLYPAEDGRWNILDIIPVDPAAESYADLESACRGALDYIAGRERALKARSD